MRNYAIKENYITISMALACSFILAILSYYLVENRFRKKYSISFNKTIIILLIIPYTFIVLLNYYNDKNDGFPTRFGDTLAQPYLYQTEATERLNKKCKDIEETHQCTVGDTQATNRALLIGDSFARHSLGFFDEIGEQNNIKIDFIFGNGCFIANGALKTFDENAIKKSKPWCDILTKDIEKFINQDYQ